MDETTETTKKEIETDGIFVVIKDDPSIGKDVKTGISGYDLPTENAVDLLGRYTFKSTVSVGRVLPDYH
jgi:hypothetical protein